MNSFNIIGRLGRDPEKKKIADYDVVTFSIAETISKDKTQWFNCEAWNKTGENIAKYFHKGDMIAISGRIKIDDYEKDGVKKQIYKVNVNEFAFCGGKSESSDEYKPAPNEKPTKYETKNDEPMDDVPF